MVHSEKSQHSKRQLQENWHIFESSLVYMWVLGQPELHSETRSELLSEPKEYQAAYRTVILIRLLSLLCFPSWVESFQECIHTSFFLNWAACINPYAYGACNCWHWWLLCPEFRSVLGSCFSRWMNNPALPCFSESLSVCSFLRLPGGCHFSPLCCIYR